MRRQRLEWPDEEGEGRFQFGKFRGWLYADVPDWYVNFITERMPIVAGAQIIEQRQRQLAARKARHEEAQTEMVKSFSRRR